MSFLCDYFWKTYEKKFFEKSGKLFDKLERGRLSKNYCHAEFISASTLYVVLEIPKLVRDDTIKLSF